VSIPRRLGRIARGFVSNLQEDERFRETLRTGRVDLGYFIDPAEADELFAITSNGGVMRTPVKPVRRTRDRNTMGVKLMNLPEGVTLVAIARNADEPDEQE
jgi:DNA gyrase subunit A